MIDIDEPRRTVPVSLNAEMRLLGTLLMDNQVFDRVRGFLRTEHFADPVHGVIYRAIEVFVGGGRVADAESVAAELVPLSFLDDMVGDDEPPGRYLLDLTTTYADDISHVEGDGRSILDAWVRLNLLDVSEQLSFLAPEVATDAFNRDSSSAAKEQAACLASRLRGLTASVEALAGAAS